MKPENKAKLACQKSGTTAVKNLNKALTDEIQKIAKVYEARKLANNAAFKLKNYKKVRFL